MTQNLQSLISSIQKEFGLDKGLADVNVDHLTALMNSYQSNPEDFKDYVHFNTSKYTRNLVDSGNGKYNLLVLCWSPNQISPIHDHADSQCLFKTLIGDLTESRFDWPKAEEAMRQVKETVYSKNEVNFMNNSIGLHQVGNKSLSKPAISLHLYSPPIQQCQTFVQATGQARSSGNCCMYSKFGKLVNHFEISPVQSVHIPRTVSNLPIPDALVPDATLLVYPNSEIEGLLQ